jgi:hypothetical protein
MIQINNITFVIEYIFIINLFKNINVNIIFYKFDQTWTITTDMHSIIASFVDTGVLVLIYSVRYGSRYTEFKWNPGRKHQILTPRRGEGWWSRKILDFSPSSPFYFINIVNHQTDGHTTSYHWVTKSHQCRQLYINRSILN